MSKQIFILFLFFCSLQSFCQKSGPNAEDKTLFIINNKSVTANSKKALEKNDEISIYCYGELSKNVLCGIFDFPKPIPVGVFNENLMKKSTAEV